MGFSAYIGPNICGNQNASVFLNEPMYPKSDLDMHSIQYIFHLNLCIVEKTENFWLEKMTRSIKGERKSNHSAKRRKRKENRYKRVKSSYFQQIQNKDFCKLLAVHHK